MLWYRVARAIPVHASAVLVSAAVACGGASPSTQAPAAVARPALSPPPPPPPDLSAVDPPATMIVSGRLARPSAALAAVRGWSNLPMPQSEQATELLLGDALGALIDLDQPVDFAAAVGKGRSATRALGIDASPLLAVSAAIKNIDAAKAALSDHYKLVPADNGALTIQSLDRSSHADDDEDEDAPGERRSCEIAPAYGSAPTRLVCAFGDDAALRELGPWLTRGATRTPSKADAHADVRLQPLKALIAQQGKMMGALVGGLLSGSLPLPSLRDLAVNAVDDFVDFVLDLDTVSVDLNLEDTGARAVIAAAFSTTKSTMARLVTAQPDRAGPPPALFWQMPADATSAGFSRGTDPALLAHAWGLLRRIAGEELASDGVGPADRKAIADALDKLPISDPAVIAAGVDVDAVTKAVAANAPGGGAAGTTPEGSIAWGVAAQLFGWHVAAVEEATPQCAAAIKDLASAWSRPSVVAAYRTKLKGAAPPALRTTPAPKGRTWPKNTAQYVLEWEPPASSGRAAKPPAPGGHSRSKIEIHCLVVPDGPRTWIAVAADEALAVSKLVAAMSGSGETLAAKTELAPLKEASVGTAGFWTLREFAGEGAAIMSVGGLTEPFAEIAQLPQRGATPITFTSTAKKSPAGTVWTMQLPRGAIQDFIIMVLRHS